MVSASAGVALVTLIYLTGRYSSRNTRHEEVPLPLARPSLLPPRLVKASVIVIMNRARWTIRWKQLTWAPGSRAARTPASGCQACQVPVEGAMARARSEGSFTPKLTCQLAIVRRR